MRVFCDFRLMHTGADSSAIKVQQRLNIISVLSMCSPLLEVTVLLKIVQLSTIAIQMIQMIPLATITMMTTLKQMIASSES